MARFASLFMLAAIPLSILAQGAVTNIPPTVRIVEPAENVAVYSISNSVLIRAEASDADGVVSEVRLLQNGTLVASDFQAPYEFIFEPGFYGSFTIQVQAVDDKGATGSSTRIVEYVRVNDNFGQMPILTGTNITVRSTTVNATRQKGEPNHAGAASGRSIWWTWRPATTGTVTIDTFGSDFDTVLGVYTNSLLVPTPAGITNLLFVAANDDDQANPPLSRVKFTALANRVYCIAVDGRDGFAGNVVLNIRQTLSKAGPNDFLSSAGNMFGTMTVNANNIGATKEPDEPDHAGNPGGASMWWRYQGAQAPVSISTAGSTFDTMIAVYTNVAIISRDGSAPMENLRMVISNDDAGSSTSRTSVVNFTPRLGTTYWIAVDGYNGAEGNIRLTATIQTTNIRPTNDMFKTSTILNGSSVITNVNTFSTTSEFGEPLQIAPKIGGKSVWYRWVAPVAGSVYVTTKGSDFDTLLGVYVGTNITTLDPIASNDDDGGLPTSALTFEAVGGIEYRIAVAGYQGASGNLLLTLNQPQGVVPRLISGLGGGHIVIRAIEAEANFVLEESEDLVRWSVVGTVDGEIVVESIPQQNVSRRFYRLREVEN